VLVVDDDETVADLLVHALKMRGYSVRWIGDGMEAQRALTGDTDRLRARLVLLDVDLPGTDGISILRELRRSGILQDTRIIMLTARSTESEILKMLELDAFDHIAKPFSIPVLLQRIRRALAG
jgi:DNA-binding response OmpR family regulator